MSSAEDFINRKLDERKQAGNYRSLKPESGLVDFCSNDYLGFARLAKLKELTDEEVRGQSAIANGSTGSRLLSGNSLYAENLEQELAQFHQSEAALLFNSGYDANIGLFSSIPQRGDTIIHDELIHASIIDGCRLSHANRYSFRHNDLASLEEKLQHAKGICYVAIESVYSMDGDTPPIKAIIDLARKYNANLIVDEAHAVGVYDNGLICQLGLEKEVFARVVTFGKALGCHGAAILGSESLRNYLINFARSFIYTTAAGLHHLASIRMAYQQLPGAQNEIGHLQNNIALLKEKLSVKASEHLIKSDSAIQCLVVNSNEKATSIAAYLQSNGLDVRPILSPTVPEGTERIRICMHSFNSVNEVTLLAESINHFFDV